MNLGNNMVVKMITFTINMIMVDLGARLIKMLKMNTSNRSSQPSPEYDHHYSCIKIITVTRLTESPSKLSPSATVVRSLSPESSGQLSLLFAKK